MAALQSSTNRRDWRFHFLLVTNLINEANALRASFLECHLMDDTNHETVVEGQTLRMRGFWLIAVFLVVTVASCAWYFHSVDAQDKRLAQAIKAGGGDVGYRFSGPEWTPQNFRDSAPFLEVVNAVEPIERIVTCPLGPKSHGKNLCPLHRRMDDALASVEAAFGTTTLAEVLSEPTGSPPLCDPVKSIARKAAAKP